MTDPTPLSTPARPVPSDTSQNTPGNLPSRSNVPSRMAVLDPPAEPPEPSRQQVWMHRVSIFLFVLVSAVAGVLLIILPWTPEWTDNYLLLSYPSLRVLVGSGFFRGICSGLGLLDIWIGFWEAFHYHEQQ
jgi:hypothetical protein